MSIFFMTSLFAFGLFQLAAQVVPSWERNRALARGQAVAIIFIVVILLLTVVCGWFLVYATFGTIPPPLGLPVKTVDALLGRNAFAIVCGAIVGVLFGLFFNKIFYDTPDAGLSLPDKFILAMLVLFVVLGMGGEEYIRGLGHRLTKVSAVGVEVAFSTPGQGSAQANAGNVAAATGSAASTSSASFLPSDGSSAGLQILSQLNAIIARDAYYIGSLKQSDSPIMRGSAEPTVRGGLMHAQHFVTLFVAPLASCVSHVYRRYGDTDFVDAQLQPFLPMLREMLAKPSRTDKLANDFRIRLLQQSHAVLDRVYASEILRDRKWIVETAKSTNARYAPLADECADLIYLLCRKKEWTRKDVEALVEEAGKQQIEGKSRFEWLQDQVKPNGCLYADTDTFPDIGSHSFADAALLAYLFDNKYDFQSRPYLATILASIMAQSDHYEAALTILQLWVDGDERSNNFPDEPWAKWLTTRALNTITALTEEWIRKRSPSVPSALRDYHIGTIARTVALYGEIFDLGPFITSNATLSPSWEDVDFKQELSDQQGCKLEIMSVKGRIFYAYVKAQLLQAHHSLLHPDYLNRFAPKVRAIVQSLMRTHFSCMLAPGGVDEIKLIRAESLGVFARMKLADAIALSSIRDKTSLAADLQTALDAASLGLKLVQPLYDADIGGKKRQFERGGDLTLLERISTTESIDTYETLAALKSDIGRQLDRANE